MKASPEWDYRTSWRSTMPETFLVKNWRTCVDKGIRLTHTTPYYLSMIHMNPQNKLSSNFLPTAAIPYKVIQREGKSHSGNRKWTDLQKGHIPRQSTGTANGRGAATVDGKRWSQLHQRKRDMMWFINIKCIWQHWNWMRDYYWSYFLRYTRVLFTIIIKIIASNVFYPNPHHYHLILLVPT